MDLGYNNPLASKWVTNVGLVTSEGPNGADIMAAEWTYYVSYSPALISVHVGRGKSPQGKATTENIRAAGKFGVSLAADGQNWVSSVAGGGSGRDIDKIAILRELGVEFEKGEKLGVLLVKGAAMHAECRLKDIIEVGDHFMIIGEVEAVQSFEGKDPLLFNFGKYHQFGPLIEKPPQEFRDKIAQLKIKHARKQ